MAQAANSWQEIHDEVLRRIRTREWRPGALIPSELELAEEFRCARATVGRALTALAEDGVLDRRRRAGTRVAETPVRRATLSIPIIRKEIEAVGARYRHVLLEKTQTAASDAAAARLDLPPGTGLLRLRTLHLADDRPHAAEDRWVNPAAVPDILKADLDAISPNEWLVQNAWYSDGTLTFGAEAATPEDAELLQIPPSSPVIVLDRVTRAGDDPVTSVRLVHPTGYRLSLSL
jgi:GntR family histidine utilization transcriptional repressor